MSGAATTVAAFPPTRPQPTSPAPRAASAAIPLPLELAVFAALAAYGLVGWARLVEPMPFGRMLAALLAICAGAALLRAIAAGERRGLAMVVVAATVSVVAMIGALVVVGLPARLLAPPHWDEFREQLRLGLGGIEETRLPYAGADSWIRLTLVLGGPALVGFASAIAFWPARTREPLRVLGLVVLLLSYGVPVTLDNPSVEVLWGVPLLVGSVAWLWIARLAGRRLVALAFALAAGLLALPIAGKLNAAAWWDYQTWNWFGAERAVSFQWNHDYGPLDWQRDGTTMLTVQTDTPLYWKASVLDRFDGYRWERAESTDVLAGPEYAARTAIPGAGLLDGHPGWVTDSTFEIRALASSVVIGAGTALSIDGVDGVRVSPDGTLSIDNDPLSPGDHYSVASYVPQPTVDQLRRAPVARNEDRFSGSTLLGIPSPPLAGVDAPVHAIPMPLWGTHDPLARQRLLDSPYADTFRLASRWIAGARTPYDAVRAIDGHLRRDFVYTPNVPQHTFPLPAFLFADKAGYCQQFAGTMGLMLRMLGIPTRVVSGFAPGSEGVTRGTFEVHDFDAHSWVEVYFREIGWVTFDPTPAAAPAESQRLGGEFATAFRGLAPNPAIDHPGPADGGAGGEVSAQALAPPSTGTGPWPAVGIVVATLLLAGAGAAAVLFARRRHRLASGAIADAQISELRAALARLGWRLDPGTTLLAIERRFTGARRTAVRRYAASLREHRYGPDPPPPPGPGERRALRRALSVRGLRGRLRALIAIPPGGPARP